MITEGTRLGSLLRTRRETLGLSLEDVEAAIRIRAHYLLAMEADEWQRLPGEVVGRGFLQNYAAFLKLDGQELKQHRQSDIVARLNENWPSTSGGASMPPLRDMDYRPLESQPTGAFFLTGQGPSQVWRRFLFTGLLLVVVTLIIAAFLANPGSALPTGTILTSLRTEATRRMQDAYGQLVDGLRTTFQDTGTNGGSPAAPLVVEVPPPTATPVPAAVASPTPVPTVPTPTATPAPAAVAAPTPVPTPTSIPAVGALAPVNCDVEGMQITSPRDRQIIGDVTALTGTAAVTDQWYYKLEYRIVAGVGQAQRQAFTYFDGYVTTVTEGSLGELNTVFMTNGDYTVRLTAVQQDGTALTCDFTVTVQN